MLYNEFNFAQVLLTFWDKSDTIIKKGGIFMATKAGENLTKTFDEKELKYEKVNMEGEVYRLGFNLDVTSLTVFVQVGDDGTDLHLEGVDFVKIPSGKDDIAIEVCNQLNNQFRWIKFVWDDKNECVNARADGVINDETCGEIGYELLYRMIKIVEDSYATFMKAIWA